MTLLLIALGAWAGVMLAEWQSTRDAREIARGFSKVQIDLCARIWSRQIAFVEDPFWRQFTAADEQ